MLGTNGPSGKGLARSFRTIWAFSWCFTERYRRLANPEASGSVIEGEDIGATRWGPKAPSSSTAHIGPWETATHFGASNAPRRVHIVRENEIDPRAQQFIEDLLSRSGNTYVTHFAGEDLTLAIELAEPSETATSSRCSATVLARRTDADGDSIGRPMPLPTGPAALARAARSRILPVFNFRDGRVPGPNHIVPPILVAHTADRDAT